MARAGASAPLELWRALTSSSTDTWCDCLSRTLWTAAGSRATTAATEERTGGHTSIYKARYMYLKMSLAPLPPTPMEKEGNFIAKFNMRTLCFLPLLA